MLGYNIKGVGISLSGYSKRCNFEGCNRAAYYKFNSSSAVGKAFINSKRQISKYFKNADGTPGTEIPYGTGYFCTFDCARKYLLSSAFETKVKLTPLVRDYIGQGKVPITDHETIIDSTKDISFKLRDDGMTPKDIEENCFLKISPNGIESHPFQLDLSNNGVNIPIGFSREGLVKVISTLQSLVDQHDLIKSEIVHMTRRKRLDKNKPA